MKNFWFVIRVFIVALSAASALLDNPIIPRSVQSDWLMPLAGLLLFPAIAVVGLVILFLVRGRTFDFSEPSWWKNPLNFSHPEQFFHLAACAFLAGGAAQVLHNLVNGSRIGAADVATFFFGAGIWIGLRIMGFAYAMQVRKINRSSLDSGFRGNDE